MATKTDYSKKLLDPRWQKKRLKILERDNWTCTSCGRSDLNLQVHHEQYTGEPWDISDSKLKTLCCLCHENTHKQEPETIYLSKHLSPPRNITNLDIEASFDVESDIPFSIKAFFIQILTAKTNPPDWILKSYPDIDTYIKTKEHYLNEYCLRHNVILNWDEVYFGIGDETKLMVL